MKYVSEAYKESINQRLRNRSYVRVLFTNTDTTIPSDGKWESPNELFISNTDTLDYNHMYGNPYATMELNQWLLDGSFDIAPETGGASGFISSIISDENGEGANSVLARQFSNKHTIRNITFIFDTRTGIHPNGVTIKFFLDGAEIKSLYAPVTSDSVAVAADVEACDMVSVAFGQMPPYRRARLEGVTYGVQKMFSNDVIVSTKQYHDVDPLSRRLPKETMQFTILDFKHDYDPDNPSGIWSLIADKSTADIQIGYELPNGITEWVKADRYILDGRPAFSNNRATFKATGLLGQLTDSYYKGTYGNKSFYDMAVSVLEDANLLPLPDGTNPWVIDESLKTMYTDAPMPIDTHANCLQMIAHACRCTLRTEDNNIIYISPCVISKDTEESGFSIDFSSIGQNSQTITKIDQLKTVSVLRNIYTPVSQKELFYGITDETELHIEFSEPATDISVSVSAGSVLDSKVYANAVDLVLSAGSKAVSISGRPISKSNIMYNLNVSNYGSVDEEKNPLITDLEMCKALAKHVSEYLQLRNTYDISYRGNPELECGDVIGLQTMYSPAIKGVLLTDEITYNGAIQGKAKVKVLGVIENIDVLDNFILDRSVLS